MVPAWLSAFALSFSFSATGTGLLGSKGTTTAESVEAEAVAMAGAAACASDSDEGVTRYQIDHTTVISIEQFFPPDLAERWRDGLKAAWDNGQWTFATNNKGTPELTMENINTKTRSRDKVEVRRRIATRWAQEGQFAYAKWELLACQHPIVQETIDFLLSNATRTRVARLLGLPTAHRLDGLTSFFYSLFGAGDFLATHADAYSGTYAVVASLAVGEWQPDFGGELLLYSSSTKTWQSFPPKFNTMTLFKTRNGPKQTGPDHRVTPVTKHAEEAGFFRFGFTAWYKDVEDAFDDFSQLELKRMNEQEQ